MRDLEKTRAAVLKRHGGAIRNMDPGKPSRWPVVRLVSAVVAIAAVAAMLLWDLVPAFTAARDDTISEVFRDLLWTRYGPGFAVLGGYFVGHLVINSNRGPFPVWAMLLGFGLCGSVFVGCAVLPPVAAHPAVWCALGAFLGWAVWPQRRV